MKTSCDFCLNDFGASEEKRNLFHPFRPRPSLVTWSTNGGVTLKYLVYPAKGSALLLLLLQLLPTSLRPPQGKPLALKSFYLKCIMFRLSQGVPPPPAAFASPPGSTYSASPRSSYAGLPPPAARPPPPYRAPPPDPVQARPLPSRPSESALTSPPPPAPPKRSAAAAINVPPLLPPVAISSSPPPLPRRHPSDVGSAPSRDRSNSQDPSSSSSTRISDSQQPSPTDSGFTEDSKSFSEPLGHGRSKSYGNLTVEREDEVLTQAVSLDQVSHVLFLRTILRLSKRISFQLKASKLQKLLVTAGQPALLNEP